MDAAIRELNKFILNWWCNHSNGFPYKDKHSNTPQTLRPGILHDLNKNAEILFVGLNPSGDSKKSLINPNDNICANMDDYIDKHKKRIHDNFKLNEYSSYFDVYHKIANCVYKGTSNNNGVSDKIDNCEHIDLYQCSGTQSTQVMKWINNNNDRNHGITIFKEVLKYLTNVKVIVFNNVNASNIIYNTLNDKQMTSKMTYEYIIDNRKIDLVFSGMITGQRRIDKYSLERLCHIINNI